MRIIKKHQPCICGSGNKYKKCCEKKTFWVLEGRGGPTSYAVHEETDPSGPSLLAFSSKERADSYKGASTEIGVVSAVPITYDHFVQNLYPEMLNDGIRSLSLNLTNFYEGRGILVRVDGLASSISTDPYPIPNGFTMFGGNSIGGSKEDHDWFDKNSDQHYRVRPPLESEQPNLIGKNPIIFVVQVQAKMRFKFACDPDTVDVGDTDWGELADQMIQHSGVDEETTIFAEKIHSVFLFFLEKAYQYYKKNIANRGLTNGR